MVGGALADFHMWFLDEKFVHSEFTFDSGHFSTMEAAFKERYGEPTVDQTKEVQSRAGVSFANRELIWTGKDVHISLSKYHNKVTHGRASVRHSAYLEYVQKESKENATKAAKDF